MENVTYDILSNKYIIKKLCCTLGKILLYFISYIYSNNATF